MLHFKKLVILGILFIMGACLKSQPKEPIFDGLPHDSATIILKELYNAKVYYNSKLLDSLIEKLSKSSINFNPKQNAIKEKLVGDYYFMNRLYTEASDYYSNSLKASIENEWKYIKFINLMSLANAEYYYGNRKSAIEGWQDILDQCDSSFWFLRSNIYGNLAATNYENWLYAEEEDSESKDEYKRKTETQYELAISELKKNDDAFSLSRVYAIYAMYFMSLKDSENTRLMLTKANEMCVRSNNQYQLNFNRIKWAQFFSELGKYDQAVDSVARALNYYENDQDLEGQKHCKTVLGLIYNAAGEFQKAYENSLEMHKLKTMMNTEQMGKITRLHRVKLEVFEKEDKIVRQKELIEKQQLENQLSELNRVRWVVGAVSGIVIILLISLLWVQHIKQRAKTEKNELIIEEREKALRSVIQAQEMERKRIAQELHDGIGQQLSGVKMALQNLSNSMEKQNESLKREFKDIVGVLSNSSKEVRELAHQMMPQVLEKRGLIAALEDLIQQTYRNTGIHFTFENKVNDAFVFSADLELTLYRSIQELIINTLKHAEANKIELFIYSMSNSLMAVYSDNGIGFEVENIEKGLGLKSITSRVESSGGSIGIESFVGSGFSATFRFPSIA